MHTYTNAINLIKTEVAFTKKMGSFRVSRQRFGFPIVRMAHSTIGRSGVPIHGLPGIRECLIYMTREVSWRNYIWLVPLPYRETPFQYVSHQESESLPSLLVDSLILTVLAYQESLWEFHSNLAQILIADITNGFERLCEGINRGASITAEDNELVVPITVDIVDDCLRKRRLPTLSDVASWNN